MKKMLTALGLALILCLTAGWAMGEETNSLTLQLEQALADRAQGEEDVWARFLLTQNLASVNLEGNVLSFSLPAWDPQVESLTGEEDAWLGQIAANVSSRQITGKVSCIQEGEGYRIAGDLKTFYREVEKKAEYARGQFDLTQVRKAIAAHLLPVPFDGQGNAVPAFHALAAAYGEEITPARLAVALSAQGKSSLGVKNGPEELRMVFYSAPAQDFYQDAYEDALSTLSAMDMSNALSREEIALHLAKAFARQAQSYWAQTNKGEKQAMVFSLPRIFQGQLVNQDFLLYAQQITQGFEDWVTRLEEKVRSLPDYPVRETPDTGVLQGNEQDQGTLIILRAQDDGQGRYFAAVDMEGQAALRAFINPGDSLRAWLDEGQYFLLSGAGENWYGEVMLLGQEGSYVMTKESVTVQDSTRYHTITLGSDQALDVEEMDLDAFVRALSGEKPQEPAEMGKTQTTQE